MLPGVRPLKPILVQEYTARNGEWNSVLPNVSRSLTRVPFEFQIIAPIITDS